LTISYENHTKDNRFHCYLQPQLTIAGKSFISGSIWPVAGLRALPVCVNCDRYFLVMLIFVR